MEPTRAQLMEALKKADAAGDIPAAKAIARRIKTQDPITQGAEDYAAAGGTERFANDARQRQAESDASVNAIGPNIVAGVTEGLRSSATGALQLGTTLATNPLAAIENVAGIENGPAATARQVLDDYSATRQQAFAASPAGNSAWGIVPKYATQAAAMYPLAAASVPAKGAGALRIIGQGSLGGAGMGLVSEGTTDQKLDAAAGGAVLGGLVPASLIGAGKAGGAVTDFVSKRIWQTDAQARREAGTLFNELTDNPADALANITRLNREYVPGSVPTTAELSGDVGLLAAQNARKSASNDLRNFINNRSTQNDAAREQYIRDTFEGADDATYQALKAYRDDQGAIDRLGLMEVKGINIRPVARYIAGRVAANDKRTAISGILRPITNELFRKEIPQTVRTANAQNLIRDFLGQSGRSLDAHELNALRLMAAGKPVPSISQGALDTTKNAGIQSLLRAYRAVKARGNRDVDDFHRLYNARKSLNDLMETKGGTDMESQRLRQASSELARIRDRLDEQIVEVAPEFAQYLETFKGTSARMEQNLVGQELLASANVTNGQFAGATAREVANPTDLVNSVAGISGKKATESLTTDQQQALTNIGADIRRQRSATGKGSAAIEAETRGVGGIGTLSPAGLVANKALNAIARQHGKKAMMVFDEMLQNPDRAVQILAQLPAQNRTSILRKYLPAFGLQASYGLMRAIQDESRQKPKYAELPAYTP